MKSESVTSAIDVHQVADLVIANLFATSAWQWVALLLWHALLAAFAHRLFVLFVLPLGDAITSLVAKGRTSTRNDGADHV